MSQQAISSVAVTRAEAGSGSRLLPALLAMALGVLVIGFAGFSPLEIIHNAAHDTRHAIGFPCH